MPSLRPSSKGSPRVGGAVLEDDALTEQWVTPAATGWAALRRHRRATRATPATRAEPAPVAHGRGVAVASRAGAGRRVGAASRSVGADGRSAPGSIGGDGNGCRADGAIARLLAESSWGARHAPRHAEALRTRS